MLCRRPSAPRREGDGVANPVDAATLDGGLVHAPATAPRATPLAETLLHLRGIALDTAVIVGLAR